MFDSRKIDVYFEETNSIKTPKVFHEKGVSWRRVFKLMLPCVAAALLGVMVVMPNVRKSVDLQDDITIPHKNEMEKLHIEETVFSSTDNKNRVNKVTADSVDETSPGSKIMKIINPQGSIPTDSGVVDIVSDEGFFDQNTNIINLYGDVHAVVDNNTVITSSEVSYDFNTGKGEGNKPVSATGDWGTLDAEAFAYDKNEEILTLKGNNTIKGNGGVLTAHDKTIIYQKENKTVSTGKASVSQKGSDLFADKIIAYFNGSGKRELVRAEAYGNVVIKTPSETAFGKEGVYNPQIGEIILYGSSQERKNDRGFVKIRQGDNVLYAEKMVANLATSGRKDLQNVVALGAVKVVTPKETVTGKEGHYDVSKGEIILYGDFLTTSQKKGRVVIHQGENTLQAEKVTAYLNKGRKKDLQKAIAVGSVEVFTPKGSARGDKGVYSPENHKVELFDNVRIEQNGNFIDGAYAETDLLTSVSRIIGDKNTGGRIHGIFYKTRK